VGFRGNFLSFVFAFAEYTKPATTPDDDDDDDDDM